MKKIAIVQNRMIVGGVEAALMQLLKHIDTSKYDVTLFTFSDQTPYYNQIPESVHVVFTKNQPTRKQFFDDLKHFRVFSVFRGVYHRLMIRLCNDNNKVFTHTLRTYKTLPGYYDCAIAYKMNFEDTAIILNLVSAPKKFTWMHSSVNFLDAEAVRFCSQMLRTFDHIFCVSEHIKAQLDSLTSEKKTKTTVIHNLFPKDDICAKAVFPMDIVFDHPALVTVGRLSPEKGQQMIPKTVRLLLNAGYPVHWYLIGDGPLRAEIEENIREFDVADHVTLLGTRMNPYPYMKNCQIYVQTSYSEGFCITTTEAKILQKPIVTTNVPVMREQFISGENGLIVDDMTPEALFEGIRTLLDHPELQEKFVENLKKETFDNSKELQKLYDFIES